VAHAGGAAVVNGALGNILAIGFQIFVIFLIILKKLGIELPKAIAGGIDVI
jgi:hypothetical protein